MRHARDLWRNPQTFTYGQRLNIFSWLYLYNCLTRYFNKDAFWKISVEESSLNLIGFFADKLPAFWQLFLLEWYFCLERSLCPDITMKTSVSPDALRNCDSFQKKKQIIKNEFERKNDPRKHYYQTFSKLSRFLIEAWISGYERLTLNRGTFISVWVC